MSFKYFLGLQPEDNVINSSSLTKFRKQRLVDANILDLLIRKSMEIALENNVIKSKTIIVDATHTNARYHKTRIKEMLAKQTQKLIKSVAEFDSDFEVAQEPLLKRSKTEDIKKYSEQIYVTVKAKDISELPEIKENADLLREMLDDHTDTYDYSFDPEARIGHKTRNNSFYGYKTHLAMSEEFIITAATITSGEATDGKELPDLIDKTLANGMEVEEVIGDMAYSSIDNIENAEKNKIQLIAKLHPRMTIGARPKQDGFVFNKDAATIQCPAGNLAKSSRCQIRQNQRISNRLIYNFDVETCKKCPKRDGCYKEGCKTKTYSYTIKRDWNKALEEFQKTEYFKERVKIRYRVEAKNSELKNIHGYNRCETAGTDGLKIQGTVAIFTVNLKRIIKLLEEVRPKTEQGK